MAWVSNELLGKFPIPNQLPRKPQFVSSNPIFTIFTIFTPKVFDADLPQKGQLFPSFHGLSRQPFERSLQLASLMTKWRSPDFASRSHSQENISATDSKDFWLVGDFKSIQKNDHQPLYKCWIPNGFKKKVHVPSYIMVSSWYVLNCAPRVAAGYDWQSLWYSSGVVLRFWDACEFSWQKRHGKSGLVTENVGLIWDITGYFMGYIYIWKLDIMEIYGSVWKCWVYPQWNSHLVGIMISKTIGFFGVHNIFRQSHFSCGAAWRPLFTSTISARHRETFSSERKNRKMGVASSR